MNKSLFKRATAIAAASALALSATLIAPLLTSAAACRDCESTDRAVRGYESYVCPVDSLHDIGDRETGACGHVYGACGGTLSTELSCSNTLCDDPTGSLGTPCTNTIACPGTFVINCTNTATLHTPGGTVNTQCTNDDTINCAGDITLMCSNSGDNCTAHAVTSGTAGACPGQKDCDGDVSAKATCPAGHTPVNTDIGDTCDFVAACTELLDGDGECSIHADASGGSENDPCGEDLDPCTEQVEGECTKCTNGTYTSAGACSGSGGTIACGGTRTASCSNTCGTPSSTAGTGACTNKVQCTGTIQGKCNAAAGTGCEGATTSTTTITGPCTATDTCGGALSGLRCTNPKSVDHVPTGTVPGNCETSLPNCVGSIRGVDCTNAWHDEVPPPPPPPANNDSGNGGGGASSGGGGGSVVADMIAGGGIGGGGGGTNNTESGGGGKEVKVIADSAEAKLAVGNVTRGTVTLSPDMGATSDVLEALTTVGANVKVWIPHGTHGVAIKGSDLGEGELKDLSFKGGAVAVPESIKSSFPEAKSITGMGFVESGDFGGVDQVMLSVRLDLDPKLWGSVITVYSVGEDGSLTKLEASRIVSGNGMVNVTITNYNSLIFVV